MEKALNLAHCSHCHTPLRLYTTLFTIAYWCQVCQRDEEQWLVWA